MWPFLLLLLLSTCALTTAFSVGNETLLFDMREVERLAEQILAKCAEGGRCARRTARHR